MKKYIFATIASCAMLSCSISEQVIFNADGSGKLNYSIDMSKMIALTKDLDKSKEVTKNFTNGTDKDMDTIIYFKDFEKLAAKEGKVLSENEKANFEKMKNYQMRMVLNKEKSEMKYIMSTDFKNVSETGNIGSILSSLKEFSGKKSNAYDVTNSSSENSEVTFELNKKSFSRKVIQKPYEEVVEATEEVLETYPGYQIDSIITDSVSIGTIYAEDLKDTLATKTEYVEEVVAVHDVETQEETTENTAKTEEDFKKMGEMMQKGLDESFFDFQYTFPRKIKKVSLPKSDYKLSKDKKTIFIKYQLEEFSKNIRELNLNIEFE